MDAGLAVLQANLSLPDHPMADGCGDSVAIAENDQLPKSWAISLLAGRSCKREQCGLHQDGCPILRMVSSCLNLPAKTSGSTAVCYHPGKHLYQAPAVKFNFLGHGSRRRNPVCSWHFADLTEGTEQYVQSGELRFQSFAVRRN